jgi:hypothetical protein
MTHALTRLALVLVCSVGEGRRLGSDVEVTSQVCKFPTNQYKP